jgi:hypothetical protein
VIQIDSDNSDIKDNKSNNKNNTLERKVSPARLIISLDLIAANVDFIALDSIEEYYIIIHQKYKISGLNISVFVFLGNIVFISHETRQLAFPHYRGGAP